jgi:hypothetical protein
MTAGLAPFLDRAFLFPRTRLGRHGVRKGALGVHERDMQVGTPWYLVAVRRCWLFDRCSGRYLV